MLRTWSLWSAVGALLLLPQIAQAHFIWVVAGSQSPDGKVHVYFSEEAEPDNPKLLERIASAKLQQSFAGETVVLPLSTGTDSLVATPTGNGPHAYTISHKYGVMTRGDATFLLNYHAKCYSGDQPRWWTPVGNNEQLPLEIVPRMDGIQTLLLVTWNGQPLADAEVTIEAEGMETQTATTSKRGVVAKELPLGKRYSIRVKHVEQVAGKLDDKEYAEARHYSTLALQLPEKPMTNSLPELDPPVTSFGAAIIGDHAYVYGGHLGSAHHYSEPGQSGRFTRLNLKQPGKWEDLAAVPKRTGTAMVPYKQTLIRVGGFVARNAEEEKEDMVSMADVIQYDPATNEWTELTPLPKGRSSHDAVVIGDYLYVAGGWAMDAGKETEWHTDALVADLTKSPLVWETLPEIPFTRRAVSLGEWQGKLVVIGGMQQRGGPTKATAVYDPAKKEWSEGPELQGDTMDGFGSSAFAIGDTLYVSTMSGRLQRLSADGRRWDVIAQLQNPRFFHRMLPTAEGELLFVGGASMQSGKVSEVELFSPNTTSTGK